MSDNPYRNDHLPSRKRRVPLIIFSIVGLIVTLAVGISLLVTNSPISRGSAAADSAITPAPPPNVPAVDSKNSLPPLGKNFVLDPHAQNATPCATIEIPSSALATPDPSRPGDSTALPSPTVPNCGNGKVYGPRCHIVLPGPNPTQDAIRQKMYEVATQQKMPFSLIEAVGWQESGWQENVQACDGGIGVMQIQPETVLWLNQQFGVNYDAFDLNGNINLGVLMVKWLYNYYAPFCTEGLGSSASACTWDTVWPGARDGATVRQIVLSAYNEGPGTMAKYGIQNWHYVNNVITFWKQFLAAEQ
jgi:Transglycosylase SLT domain